MERWDDSACVLGFEEAFTRTFPQAHAVALRIVGDPASAEDIAAEALLRTLEHWNDIQLAPGLDAWVRRVAHNLAIDHVRRTPPPAPQRLEARLDDLVCTRHVLTVSVRLLPRRQREVVALRYFAGLSERECATALHLTAGSVKRHLHRALTGLRTVLGPERDAIAESVLEEASA